MTRFFTRLSVLLCLTSLLWACKEPLAPVTYAPSDCGYELPEIAFSDPATCRPLLTTFENPSAENPVSPDRLPDLPEDCPVPGASRVAYLDGVDDGSFYLHLYRGVPGPVSVQVFGELRCGDVEPVSKCLSVTSVAERFRIDLPAAYTALFVRVAVEDAYHEQFSKTNFISLAAYEDTEPRSPGHIRYNTSGKWNERLDDEARADLQPLPFSCDGTSFQRVLLNACEGDQQTIKDWVAALGITPSEEYYGEKGNVVIFDVPPGMDPHTTGGSASQLRSGLQGTGSTAEPDFIINLYHPRDPSRIALPSERVPLATKDPWLFDYGRVNEEYLQGLLRPFEAPVPSSGGTPLVATIIDSGVDVYEPNADIWAPLAYEGSRETEYVRSGYLGFDFVDKDLVPDDPTAHGHYVASSLIGQYTADANLDLVHMKTFGAEGISSYFGALVSLYEAAAIGSDIINMSWGIDLPQAPEALSCAVATAVNEGIYLFTSAGNDTLDLSANPLWPANYAEQYPEQVVTAASYWYGGEQAEPVDDNVQLLYFTNYSEKYASMAGYMTAPVPQVGDGQIIYPLGTSFTTPQVAGNFLDWRAWTGGHRLTDWQSDRYSTGPHIVPFILDGKYLPAPLRGERP